MERIIIKRAGLPDLSLVKRGERSLLSASLTRELLTSDFVQLKVKSNDVLDVRINDYITIDGRIYRMNTPPEFLQKAENLYEYDFKFEGVMYDLLNIVFFNMDGTGFATTSEFTLTGNLEHFLTVIINNTVRLNNTWRMGMVSESETKTLTFSDDSCLSALQKICQEFKVEFRINKLHNLHYINIGSFGEEMPYAFSYGKGNGLYNLSLKNVEEKNIINRLYPLGGSENLPVDYRNYSDKLKLPAPAEFLEDSAMISSIGLKEGIVNYPDIYPKRKGKITEVVDITTFKDSTMDFDLNEADSDGTKYLLPDTSPKISFTTGNLAGYEFEVAKKEGYTHSLKQFKIVKQLNEKEKKIPDADSEAFQFAVGDEYVLLDIVMPPTYITNAENELLTKATEDFEKYKKALVSYDLKISPLYIQKITDGTNILPFDIGDYITVIHTKLGVNRKIRITSVEKNLLKDGDYNVRVADEFELTIIRQLTYEVDTIKTIMQVTGQLNITRSMIGYKTTEELKNLVFDPDGYFTPENIRPNSIETNMLTVGARSQQLSCSCVFSLNEFGNPNNLSVSVGQLFSQPMEKVWNISASSFNIPDNNSRYIYARCQRLGNSGYMYASDQQIKFDSDPNDYFFLIGILHSVTSGIRVLSITIGSTTINGGLIRTGRISSLDGSTYFDLNTNEIKGNITFNVNSPAFEQIYSNMNVGGRNLLKKSREINNTLSYWGTDHNSNISTSVVDNAIIIAQNGAGTGSGRFYINDKLAEDLKGGQKYTISFSAKSTFDFLIDVGGGAGYQKTFSPPDANWNRYYLTIDYATAFVYGWMYIIFSHDDGSSLMVKDFKIENGNVPTAYTVAFEDIGTDISTVQAGINNVNLSIADIKEKTDNFTSIVGGLIMSNVISVGDNTFNQNAFLSGITDAGGDSIRFGAGANYANKNTAPFRILDNGKMIATNADITGKIKATSGEFGTGNSAFTIKDYGIKSQQGEVEFGDFISGSYARIGNTDRGSMARIEIIDTEITGLNKKAIHINVSNGFGGLNDAIFVQRGDIKLHSGADFKVPSLSSDPFATYTNGISGTFQIEEWRLRISKGIVIECTHTG